MISAIGWVPAGVADPSPKRYELSAREREMIQAMEQEEQADEATKKASSPKETHEFKRKRGTMKVVLSANESANALPPDLRMDEYSSDEDGDEAIGELLVGQQNSVSAEIEKSGKVNDEDDDGSPGMQQNHGDNVRREVESDEDDDDDEDDLNDVPDMREFMPVDADGLNSMGLYGIGMGAGADMEEMNFDEDDSEAEDVRLTEDDALVLVAKTEDVSV